MSSQWMGDVTGNAIQTGAIHGDVYLTTPRHRAAALPPPAGWDELPDLPVEISSLLHAQVLIADQLPYRLRGARTPSLSTVYVRQDLGNHGEEIADENRPRPMVDGHGQLADVSTTPVVRTSVRPPSRTVREILETDDHLVVTGGPGQGKSTLALRLAADIALSWTASGTPPVTEPVVPLRLPARELAARLDVSFAEALAASARAEYNLRLKCAVDPAFFEDRVAGCRWLLLVDGLDEVTSANDRDHLVHALAGWAAAADIYRIVLTTRPIEGDALAPLQRIGAVRYELQPFDEEALRQFAMSWFADDGDAAAGFLRQIRKAYLDELVRVPLLATIAAIIFEEHREHPLPDNQYELYEAYLKYLRTGHQTRPTSLNDHRDALLEHLGLVRIEADTSLLGAARSWAAHAITGEWQDDLLGFLTAVGPFTLRGGDVQFLHHSFADHLSATAKARLLPSRFSADHNDFAHLLHAARLKERGRHARRVLLHYGRLHPGQADELLRWLHSGDSEQHLLAARLLAGHLPAGTEAVDAFLNTARAWAMTTQYNAHEILEGVSRATHHAGLSKWLADLMTDGKAPWRSRVEAAAALATRLRGAYEKPALTRLHAVVSDLKGQTGDRLAAAEALADCGRTEREAAERTLRAIVADPLATPSEHRNAALVMAALSGDARTCATEALLDALDDPEAPPVRLVEAAVGLIEITTEHYERCASVLAGVLRSGPVWNGIRSLQMAVDALGSLGTRHVATAADVLTDQIIDATVWRLERVSAAELLARLGPTHRASAATFLLALATEPGVPPQDLWQIAEALGRCGPEHHEQAVSMLRSVLADVTATVNDVHWAAKGLAEISPAHRAEAHDHLMRVSEATGHRSVPRWEHASALGAVARTDGSRRSHAVDELRADLADSGVDLRRRNQAAHELTELGPDFHAEVTGHLHEMATQRFDSVVMASAWRILAQLDTELRTESLTRLLELVRSGSELDDVSGSGPVILRSAVDDVERVAHELLKVLNDRSRDVRARGCAAQILITFGQPYHRAVVDGLIDLIRMELVPRRYLGQWLREITAMAHTFQAEIAQTLCAMAVHADSIPAVVLNAAEAMQLTNMPHSPEVVTALTSILLDEAAAPEYRLRSALLVARARPDLVGEASAAILSDHRHPHHHWQTALWELALLGADPAPQLHELGTNPDIRVRHRIMALGALARLTGHDPDNVVELLRRHSDDEYLAYDIRVVAMETLAEISFDHALSVIAHHRRVRDSLSEEISNRCESAFRLQKLNFTAISTSADLLHRLASDPGTTMWERALAVKYLHEMTYYVTVNTDRLANAIVNDPLSGTAARSIAVGCRQRRARLDVQRLLLTDRSIPLDKRIPALDRWSFQPLQEETEVAVRAVIDAPESTQGERVAAAAALARLSTRLVDEAAAILDRLGIRGQQELAKLGPRWSSQVLASARADVDDETKPRRKRWQAACLMWMVAPSVVRSFELDLRKLAPPSDEQRMDVAEALRTVDGLGPLRALRDNPRERTASRWSAAKRLREYDFADRVAGARVLETIASDSGCRSPLRWRAGEDLTLFGAKGRERGVAVLSHMTADDSLATMARVEAAAVIGRIRPDLRTGMVRFLRGFRQAEKPLQRIRVHELIGAFEPAEGARALRTIADDQEFDVLVRLRAAEAMFRLRRDYREAAAVVARRVIRDETTPWHIKRRAARDLAQWSDLCLDEARAVLI